VTRPKSGGDDDPSNMKGQTEEAANPKDKADRVVAQRHSPGLKAPELVVNSQS